LPAIATLRTVFYEKYINLKAKNLTPVKTLAIIGQNLRTVIAYAFISLRADGPFCIVAAPVLTRIRYSEDCETYGIAHQEAVA
jgi:hypothetical protein